jgi:hypothetical protein
MNAGSSDRNPNFLWRSLLTVESLEDRCTPSQVTSITTLGVTSENNSTQPSVSSLLKPLAQSPTPTSSPNSIASPAQSNGSSESKNVAVDPDALQDAEELSSAITVAQDSVFVVRLAVPGQGPLTSDEVGSDDTSSTPVRAVPQATVPTSANQIGNPVPGAVLFVNTTGLSRNSTVPSLPVENIAQLIPTAIAIPDRLNTSTQALPTDPEVFTPIIQISDLFQNPTLGNVDDLEAGLRHFLDDLAGNAERAIETPGNTSLIPWATAAVFSGAALELARIQLRRLAVEGVPDMLAAARSSGLRHRLPRTES